MIKSLYLKDFRNYKEAMVHFSPTINLIWGDNAQGKTNLLEALFLFITGRSFRTSHLNELIRFGAKSFYLQLVFEKNGIEQTLKFSFDGKERKIIHNATSLPSLSALLGILNGVVLSPEDRALIKGGPSLRRQFLDILQSQAKPLYLSHLSRYSRAMQQRNHLLKNRNLSTLDIWEAQMADAAALLTQMRAQTVEELENLSQSEALGSDQLKLSYRTQAHALLKESPVTLTSFFLQQFLKHRSREFELASTLTGPHRDDIYILVQDKEARHFASEGQQRSCIAALKLAEWKWIKAITGTPPLFGIDDLGVSFDSSREQELFQKMSDLGSQVFITSARPSPFPCHPIPIQSGSVNP